jgi:hypothetical protein
MKNDDFRAVLFPHSAVRRTSSISFSLRSESQDAKYGVYDGSCSRLWGPADAWTERTVSVLFSDSSSIRPKDPALPLLPTSMKSM